MNYSYDPNFQSIYQDALIKAGMFPGGPSYDSTGGSGSRAFEQSDSDWRNITSTSAVGQSSNVANNRNDYYQQRRRSRSRSRSRDRHRRRSRSRSRERSSHRRNRSRSRSHSRYTSRSPPRHRRTPSPDPISAKIMMNNLPIDASRETISYLIARQGFHPLDIRIVRRTSETGMVRVFGFVEFNTPAQAQSWMKYSDGSLLFEDGTRARLEFSREIDYDSRRPAPGSSDWTCAKCTINNFNRRSSCFKCGTSRQESEAMEAKGFALVGVHPSDTLLIRELPASATEEIVRTSLAQYTGCVIQRVHVAPSRSYALIQMKSVEEASYMLSIFNKVVPYVDNCAVIVTFSRLSLNQVLLKDNVNALKSQSGITSANIQQDPTNSAALLAQNALMMVQMGKHKPPTVDGSHPITVTDTTTTITRESVSTPFGYLQSYPTPDRSTFQLEPVSGYMYDNVTTFYFDPKTEYYFNSKSNQWMFWCSRYSTYIPCEGGDQALKKQLQADEKAEEQTRSSAVISALPSAAGDDRERRPVGSGAASSSEQDKIAEMLQACMEQNKMIMTVLNKLPDAKTAVRPSYSQRRRPSSRENDNDVILIGKSRRPATDKRIFVDEPMAVRSEPDGRRVIIDEDVEPRDRIVRNGIPRMGQNACGGVPPDGRFHRYEPAELLKQFVDELQQTSRGRSNIEEAIRVVERRNKMTKWGNQRSKSPSSPNLLLNRNERSRSPPFVQPPRRGRWSDREDVPPEQPLQKSPIVQMRPILPQFNMPPLNVPTVLATLGGLLPPLRPVLPAPQLVPPPRLSVSVTPGSTRSVHIQPSAQPSNNGDWKIVDVLERNRKYLMKLERDRQREELIKQAIADREKEHMARKQQLLVKEQEDIESLNICLNCGRIGHRQQTCRRNRISDEALKRVIANAREQRDKERLLKDKMKKQALDKYKFKRDDPLIRRLRDAVPDGKVTKTLFNLLCENCSQFGHTKMACRNATVNRSVVREVREAVNKFLHIFFFHFQDGEALDFSRKFQLFKMMDIVEASEVDPVSVQLHAICPKGIVRTRNLQLCSNCASLGHKSQHCARELSDRRHYEKILQLVAAYRALVKEKGHIRLKNFLPPPAKKPNDDLITLDDDENGSGGRACDIEKSINEDDDVEWIVDSSDEIELADEERDEEPDATTSKEGLIIVDEVCVDDEDDEITIIDDA